MSSVTPLAPSAPFVSTLTERFLSVRRRTLDLVRPLTPEDMMVQSCAEASPAKWHLAHTAWFFDSFILREFEPNYVPFHPDFHWLFNSYYQSFAAFPEKRLRASFSRPPLEAVLAYRAHVDQAVLRLLASEPPAEMLARVDIGLHHEEQHQELLLTDTLHAFFTNPLRPAYQPASVAASPAAPASLEFRAYPGGLHEIGHSGEGFSFDNELPRHRVWLEPYALGSRLVTCSEYAGFIADGGYRKAELWLSDGWDTVQREGWQAPLYWTENQGNRTGGNWEVFTLRGLQPLAHLGATPVSHVSFYEADAYARWAGRRLPTEFEWEAATAGCPADGNFLDSGALMPLPAGGAGQGRCRTQNFGDCWQWTASAYLGYPGYRPLGGTLGEYNGKFMSGQMVLRGGSCVTPPGHIRATYRNFFAPATRWQFSGVRLAE